VGSAEVRAEGSGQREAARLGRMEVGWMESDPPPSDMFHQDAGHRNIWTRARVGRTGPGGYELTPLGQRVQRELETVLPRLDRLLGGAKFHPDQQAANFDHRGRLGSPLNHASTFLWPTSTTKAWLTQRGRIAGPCRWRP